MNKTLWRCNGKGSAEDFPPCADKQSMSQAEAEAHYQETDHDCEPCLSRWHGGCREEVCHCHDETATIPWGRFCSHCGCEWITGAEQERRMREGV